MFFVRTGGGRLVEEAAGMVRKWFGRDQQTPLVAELSNDDLAWLRFGAPKSRPKNFPVVRAIAVIGVGLGLMGLTAAVAPLRCSFVMASAFCPAPVDESADAPVADVNPPAVVQRSEASAAVPAVPSPARPSAAVADTPAAAVTQTASPGASFALEDAAETIAATAPPFEHEGADQMFYAVATSPLVVRAGPSTEDRRLFVIQPGEKIMLLEWGAEWKSVSDTKGRSGWVLSSLSTSNPLTIEALEAEQTVAAAEPAAKEPAPAKVRTRTVRSTGVTVRSGPDTARAALFALTGGSKVTVLSEKNGWLRIRDGNGRVGWAYSRYVGR